MGIHDIGETKVVAGKTYVFSLESDFSFLFGPCLGCAANIGFGMHDDKLCRALGGCKDGVWKLK